MSRRVAFQSSLAACLLILASCATAPSSIPFAPDAAGIEYLPLAPGALVYVYADVDAARPLLDRFSLGGVSGKRSAEILDMTRYAAAAVYPELPAGPESGVPSGASGEKAGLPQAGAGGPKGVQIVAWGNYPSVRAGLSFAFSKDWKKRKSAAGKSYWYSERNGLSVALAARQAFAAMTTIAPGAKSGAAAKPLDPFALSPGTPSPEGFTEFRRGATLALWVEDPAAPLGRFLDSLGLPLQIPAEQLLISLNPAPRGDPVAAIPAAPKQAAVSTPPSIPSATDSAGYKAHIRIKTPTASQARALVSILSMTRLFVSGAGSVAQSSLQKRLAALIPILFAYPPVQDGVFLDIRTAPLHTDEIALLFSLFSVYSTQN
jgi:hypothetical protein